MSWTSVDLLTESLSNIGGCPTGLRFFTSLVPYQPRPTEHRFQLPVRTADIARARSGTQDDLNPRYFWWCWIRSGVASDRQRLRVCALYDLSGFDGRSGHARELRLGLSDFVSAECSPKLLAVVQAP